MFSVIGISETWLQDSTHHVDINGFNFVHNHRTERTGGGVGLYIASAFEFKTRTDLCFEDNAIAESLFVEIFNPKGKKYIIGVIYRPPNHNVANFISELDSLTGKISRDNKNCYIMGDFNLDLLNHSSHQFTNEFLDIMYANSFSPLITLPTRLTSHSATLIDNIFTNNLEKYAFSGLILSDISDHLPIFTIAHDNDLKADEASYIIIRDKSTTNKTLFRNHLSAINWYDLADVHEPKLAYSSFLNKFNDTYNSCFPLKKIKNKRPTVKKPWLSKGLLKSIKQKNRLYKRYLNSPSSDNLVKYKIFKNKLTHSLRIAMRLYYEEQINRNKSNCKNTWNILNEIINKSKRENKKLPSTFVINQQECSDPYAIANQFSDYFSNIGLNLIKKIPNASVSHTSFLTGNYPNTMFLEPATEQEIINVVKTFRNGVATGYDNIPLFVIKDNIDIIANPLTHLVNLSLSSGTFPDLLKIARVVPVFKSDDRRLLSNYRPISILPILSKVFEKIVYNRLINYIDRFHILIDNQYGFRSGHSTYLALLQLYNKISSAIDKNEFIIGIFLDLSKAFDTVSHDILFDKLQHYGIRATTLDWFKSYLNNRLQYVQYITVV
jgi:hypothetical protein